VAPRKIMTLLQQSEEVARRYDDIELATRCSEMRLTLKDVARPTKAQMHEVADLAAAGIQLMKKNGDFYSAFGIDPPEEGAAP
jgi:hypothetical protein